MGIIIKNTIKKCHQCKQYIWLVILVQSRKLDLTLTVICCSPAQMIRLYACTRPIYLKELVYSKLMIHVNQSISQKTPSTFWLQQIQKVSRFSTLKLVNSYLILTLPVFRGNRLSYRTVTKSSSLYQKNQQSKVRWEFMISKLLLNGVRKMEYFNTRSF